MANQKQYSMSMLLGGKLSPSLQNAFKNAQDQGSKLGKAMQAVGGAGAAIGKAALKGVAVAGTAIIGATAAIGAMTVKAADNAGQINILASTYGLSTQKVQELQYASTKLGVDQDTLFDVQSKLVKSMAAAQKGTGAQAEAYKALGISVTDAKGNLRDTNAVMTDALNALNAMPQGAQRDAYAMQLFGKSAMELNPIINAGGDAVAQLSAEAEKNGAVMSAAAVQGLDKFGLGLKGLKMSASGIVGTLASQFAPALGNITDLMGNLAGSVTTALKTGNFDQIGKTITDGVTGAISQVSGVISKMVPMASKLLSGLVNALVQALPQIMPALMGGINQLLTSIMQIITQNAPQLVNMVLLIITQIIQIIGQMLPQFIQMATQLVVSLAQGLAEQLPTLIPVIIQGIMDLLQSLIDALPQLVETGIQLVVALVQGLIQAIPQIIAALPKLISALYEGLYGAIPQIIQAGIDLLTSLVDNLPAIIDGIIEAIPEIISGIVDAIMENIPAIITAGINLIVALVEDVPRIVMELVKAIPKILKGVVSAFISIGKKLFGEAGTKIINALWDGIRKYIGAVVDIFKDIWGGIVGIWNSVANWFNSNVIQPIVKFFTNLWNTITSLPGKAWDAIVGVWNSVAGWFNDNVIQPVADFFTGLWDGITSAPGQVWAAISGAFASAANWFKTNVIDPIANFFTGLWQGIKSGVSSAVNTVIDVINGFIGVYNNTVGALASLIGVNIKITPIAHVALAAGTQNATGGLSLVGEHGPELVNMPRGSQVTPTNRTQSLLQSVSPAPSISIAYSPQITIQGSASQSDVEHAVKAGNDDLEKRMQKFMDNYWYQQRRRSLGGVTV